MLTTVLLADDSQILREAITRLLCSDHEIRLVGEAVNFGHAVKLVSELCPQVTILDLHMSDGDRMPPNQIKLHLQRTRVVAISLSIDDTAKAMAASFGALILLDKMKLFTELIPTIKQYAKSELHSVFSC
jgi:two-component system response regulator DevR